MKIILIQSGEINTGLAKNLAIQLFKKNNMTHLFLPYELTLKAKELGFNEPCLAEYQKYKAAWKLIITHSWDKYLYNHIIKAPIYQQIIDWIREEYDIFIHISPRIHGNKYTFSIHNMPFSKRKAFHIDDKLGFNDYYEALNEAIKQAFKLIKP